MSMRALQGLFVPPSQLVRARRRTGGRPVGCPVAARRRSNRRPHEREDVSLVAGHPRPGVVVAPGSEIAQGCRPHQRTAHYTITLEIGPRSTMLTPTKPPRPPRARLWSRCPACPCPDDDDRSRRPVNRHLEVVVYDRRRAPARSPRPTITVTDPATGRRGRCRGFVGMYDIKKGERDVHFGTISTWPMARIRSPSPSERTAVFRRSPSGVVRASVARVRG